MRVCSLHLITRLRDRSATPRLPVWRSPWHGWRSTSSQPPQRADYLEPWIALYYALPRKLSSRAELVALQWLHYSVLGFSPSPPGRPSGSPGVGVFPLALAWLPRIRTRLHLTTFRTHARFICMHGCSDLHLAQAAALIKRCSREG